MIRILFQGDSITDGGRLKGPNMRWDLNHQIGHSYVFSIVSELGRRDPGKYVFINRGVSGATVESTVVRWQRDTLDEKPDILSVLLGVNGNGKMDGSFPEGTEEHVARFASAYRSLLTSARAANPALKLILIEPFYLPLGERAETYESFRPVFRRMQGIVKSLAAETGAVFVPVQEPLEALVERTAPVLKENGCPTDPAAYWLWDGVHPTEPMHGFLADLWLAAAADLL